MVTVSGSTSVASSEGLRANNKILYLWCFFFLSTTFIGSISLGPYKTLGSQMGMSSFSIYKFRKVEKFSVLGQDHGASQGQEPGLRLGLLDAGLPA